MAEQDAVAVAAAVDSYVDGKNGELDSVRVAWPRDRMVEKDVARKQKRWSRAAATGAAAAVADAAAVPSFELCS